MSNGTKATIGFYIMSCLYLDNHGGYYIKLNDSHIVDKNTMLIM